MADFNNSPINADGTIIMGDPKYLPLQGQKMRHQIVTIHVDQKNKRYQFDTIAHTTNKRIVGVFVTSTERGDDNSKSIMDSTMSLTIDNEEILPDGFDCSLICEKTVNSFYDHPYIMNERADGSTIKGTYVSSANVDIPAGGYDVKIYLWCVVKK